MIRKNYTKILEIASFITRKIDEQAKYSTVVELWKIRLNVMKTFNLQC